MVNHIPQRWLIVVTFLASLLFGHIWGIILQFIH